MFITLDVQQEVQNRLFNTFNQQRVGDDLYDVLYSPEICGDMEVKNTNEILTSRNGVLKYRKYIDDNTKTIYWALPEDCMVITLN